MANLREKAVKGVAWSAIEKWGQHGIRFLVSLVLARLLKPEAFGLVASASVFTAFVQLILDQGMAQAIVQFADLENVHLDTAFWTSLLTGVLLTVGGIFASGLVASFFNEPKLAPVVAWLSLSLLLSALSSVQQAILRRELDYKSLAKRSLIARLGGGVLGVGAAFLGVGVWSLVVQTLIKGLIGVVVLWQVSDWRPRFRFSKGHFYDLFTFGLSTMGVRTLSFLDTRLDDLLIGRFLGTTQLGYYTIAYRLLRTMMGLLTGITINVTFSAFSRLQDDLERLRSAFYQTIEFANLIVWPVFLGMFALAPELILTLFGSAWRPAIPAMRVLALGGAMLAVVQFNGNLAWALGKPNLVLGTRVVVTAARVIAFTVAAQWGILGVAAAFTIVTYGIYAPAYTWMAHHLINLDLRTYFGRYAVPLIGALAMTAVVLGLGYILADSALHWRLVICVSVGFSTYATVIWLMKPTLFRRLLSIIGPVLRDLNPGAKQV